MSTAAAAPDLRAYCCLCCTHAEVLEIVQSFLVSEWQCVLRSISHVLSEIVSQAIPFVVLKAAAILPYYTLSLHKFSRYAAYTCKGMPWCGPSGSERSVYIR